MASYEPIDGPEVTWFQPKALERRFELRRGEARLAELAFRSSFGTMALGESARGRWTLKRVGFFKPRVTVRAEGAEKDLAVFRLDLWDHGVVAFENGPNYAWQATNFWGSSHAFLVAPGRPALTFRPGPEEGLKDMFKTQATVSLEPDAPGEDGRSILLLLGMYLLVMRQEESATTVAATTAAIG